MSNKKGDSSDLKSELSFFLRLLNQALEWPPLRRLIWKYWYEYLARKFQVNEFTFMNYGFFDESIECLQLEDSDEPNRNLLGLYHQLTEGILFEGKTVLEVGSGRGGGASYIARYFKPGIVMGMDRSKNAISLCRKIHSNSSLEFIQGDAEYLPFENNKFDIIFNVESSHCYGSMKLFLSEVHRALKPGGFFLYTDFRPHAAMAEMATLLTSVGFDLLVEREITSNVLMALDRESARKENLIELHSPKVLKNILSEFAAIRGSKIYNCFKDGSLLYKSFQLQKTKQLSM